MRRHEIAHDADQRRPVEEHDSRPSLFVERRASRRERDAGGPPRGPRPHPPRWLLPAVGTLVTVPATIVAGPLAAAAGATAVALAQSVVAARAAHEARALAVLAHTDHLTGLFNSRALWRDLGDLIDHRAAALIIADLDRFKSVNDDHGHAAGDAVLRAVGQLLPGLVADEGRCYRYGGEEFVVVLPDTGEQRAVIVAERLRRRVGEGLGAGLPDLTLSAGVAAAGPGCPGHRLLDRADRALRHAKVTGRDRVERASRVDDRLPSDDLAVRAAQRAALTIATAALEARDRETADHCDDVVVLCEAIADRLGIRGAEREHLLMAASLHDVGKVAVPHDILAKSGPLDETEWAVMREHTIAGEQILRSVPELEPVAPLVRSAHERFDGTGYPDGLSGEEIPLASRVILCADAFHAIRSDRPYRSGRSPEAAVEELEANAGTQFDPVVAATLIGVVRDANLPGPPTGLGRLLRRSPRLMALVATAAIGGSAMAAVPGLREKVRDIVTRDRPAAVSAPRQLPPASPSCAELALAGRPCGALPALVVTVPEPGAPAIRSGAGTKRRPLPVASEPGRPADPLAVGAAPLSTDAAVTPAPAAELPAPTATAPGANQAGEQAAGRSGDAPGRPDETPGRSGDAPAQGGDESPGNSGAAPGHSDGGPGNSGNAPGHSGETPGNSGNAPGHSGETPGNSGNAPGQGSGSSPGNSANAPGQGSGSNPGNSANAPGQGSGSNPGNSANAPGQGSGSSPGNSANAPGQGSGSSPGNSANNPGGGNGRG